jgi:hypothetical protein
LFVSELRCGHFRNVFIHKLMPENSLESKSFNFSIRGNPIGGNPRTPFKDDFHECGLGFPPIYK